jgi:predicted GNAT family acetyltransferase
MTADQTPEVRHNAERSRYELVLDGEVIGIADYEVVDDHRLVFPHTEIVRPLRGQGFGDQLIKGALDDVRRAGRTLVPSCWAVAEYIAEHPEYAELVAR